MNIYSIFGARPLGVAAAAALALGMATTGTASAAPATSASVANDTLTVIGTPGAELLALRLAAGDPNTLLVDFGDDGYADQSFDRSTFSHIAVFLGAGDDQFRVDQVNGAFADESLVVDAGAGDDTVAGGDGNDLIFGGAGRDSVDGNRGTDTAILGSGQDSFTWDPGDGSDTIDGGLGIDALVFNGANVGEKMSLSANGDRSVFLRDVGNIRMDMNHVEDLDVAALGGADSVTINDMTGTGFRQADIDLSSSTGTADGFADGVTVNGTEGADQMRVTTDGTQVDVVGLGTRTHITGSEPTDQLQVNGLGGNDTIRVGAGVTALIGVGVDLGTNQP